LAKSNHPPASVLKLPLGKRPRLTRAEKGEKTRQALFNAGVHVVGEVGYANAMISAITSRAQTAQGTFYNYFESRQDLFDALLPELGRELLDFIKEETKASRNALEREERSFRTFFTFLKIRPEFYRILYEAELFAPLAFKRHIDAIAEGYMRMLTRGAKEGQLRTQNSQEIEAIAYMLMGTRDYLCMRFARRDGKTISVPEWVVRAYMDLVSNSLFHPKSEVS